MERVDTLSVLAQGTYDEFVKCGKSEFAPDLSEMRGVFFNLKKKYLGFYESADADEVIREAWVSSVLAKKDKVIEAFTGFNPSRKNQKVKAKDWIALVMRNAVINASIKVTNDLLVKGDGDISDYSEDARSDRIGKGILRRDDEYIEALKGYIDETRGALASLPDTKKVSKRRLESSLRKLEGELAEEQEYAKPAPIVDFSEVYDYFDTDDSHSDTDYEARLISSMLVRLSAEEQCVLVGLFYGMTPYEMRVALGTDIEAHLENIKMQVIEVAEDERWWGDNPELLEALESYDFSARNNSRALGLKQGEALFKFSECLKALEAEFGLTAKAKQLKAIAYGKAPEVKDEL